MARQPNRTRLCPYTCGVHPGIGTVVASWRLNSAADGWRPKSRPSSAARCPSSKLQDGQWGCEVLNRVTMTETNFSVGGYNVRLPIMTAYSVSPASLTLWFSSAHANIIIFVPFRCLWWRLQITVPDSLSKALVGPAFGGK